MISGGRTRDSLQIDSAHDPAVHRADVVSDALIEQQAGTRLDATDGAPSAWEFLRIPTIDE